MKKINITYPKILFTASFVGLGSSFLAAYERVEMLKNPGDPLSCSLNPVIDCGGVLGAPESAIFGPPNTFIGMVVFSILLGLSIQLLSGGVWTKFVQKTVLALSFIMAAFGLWFFLISLYTLAKICLFCMFIWPASVFIGVYTVKYYLEQQNKLKGWQKSISLYLQKNHYTVVFTIFAIMVTMFLLKFQDYYFG